LKIQNDFARESGRNLRDAIGAGAMRPVCHRSKSAEFSYCGCDPLVVCRDHYSIDAASGGRTPADVLDHRPPPDIGERLAGQTSGVVSGGDDGDDLWRGKCSVERIRKSDRVHDES
jgi:hypothetical protein